MMDLDISESCYRLIRDILGKIVFDKNEWERPPRFRVLALLGFLFHDNQRQMTVMLTSAITRSGMDVGLLYPHTKLITRRRKYWARSAEMHDTMYRVRPKVVRGSRLDSRKANRQRHEHVPPCLIPAARSK